MGNLKKSRCASFSRDALPTMTRHRRPSQQLAEIGVLVLGKACLGQKTTGSQTLRPQACVHTKTVYERHGLPKKRVPSFYHPHLPCITLEEASCTAPPNGDQAHRCRIRSHSRERATGDPCCGHVPSRRQCRPVPRFLGACSQAEERAKSTRAVRSRKALQQDHLKGELVRIHLFLGPPSVPISCSDGNWKSRPSVPAAIKNRREQEHACSWPHARYRYKTPVAQHVSFIRFVRPTCSSNRFGLQQKQMDVGGPDLFVRNGP